MGLVSGAIRRAAVRPVRVAARGNNLRSMPNYWADRRGPMAMGAASLDPRIADLPIMMGLGASAGALAIPTLGNRLVFAHQALSSPEYLAARERERELDLMLRLQHVQQDGYLRGLEIENAGLMRDVLDFDTYEGQWRARE